jgi:iron complex outermembrane receptor protein
VTWASTWGTQPWAYLSRANERDWIAADTIDFTHGVSILAGLNETDVESNSYPTSSTSRYEKNKVTPTVALMYKPVPNLLLYSGYIESLEPGQVVGVGYTNSNTILPALTSKQYEVGSKALLGKALATLAYFNIDKASQYSITIPPATLPTYVQSGRQTNQGVEFTLSGKVTDDITLFGGATYLSPVVQKSNNLAMNGKDPVGVARSGVKMYGEYRMPFAHSFTATGGVYYTGQVYENSTNTLTLPSFATVDLGGRYEAIVKDMPLTVRVNVTNVANKGYWVTDTFAGQAFTGPPVTARASATIRF